MAKVPERITPKNVKKVAVSEKKIKEVKKELENPFVCEVCGFVSKSKSGLQLHTKSHDGEVVKEAPKDTEKTLSGTELDGVMKSQKQMTIEGWEKEPMVSCYIPLNFGEKRGSTHEVCVNGVVVVYPKGKRFDAPKSVADLIDNYLDSVAHAGDESAIDRSAEVEAALTK